MVLTPRLQTIANLVTKEKVADIGTDHGKIPVYLALNKKAKYIVASDVNQGPVDACKKNVELYGVGKNIECRKGNGLTVLKRGEVESIIIAGMGGELICNILRDSEEIAHCANELILQPMNGIDKVRKFLYENDFKITEEKLAREDRRIYVVIKASQGKMNRMDDIDFEISPFINEDDELYEYFKNGKIKEAEKILDGMRNGKTQDADREDYYKRIIKRLNEN